MRVYALCVTSDSGMATAGAKLVAAWLEGNPPLNVLRMSGEWHALTFVDVW